MGDTLNFTYSCTYHSSRIIRSYKSSLRIVSAFWFSRECENFLERLRKLCKNKIQKTQDSAEHKRVKSLSRVQLFATLWTVAPQVPPSMAFSRQEHWSGLPFPSPGESSRPRDPTQVSHIAGKCFNLWATREAHKEKTEKRRSYSTGNVLVIFPLSLLI